MFLELRLTIFRHVKNMLIQKRVQTEINDKSIMEICIISSAIERKISAFLPLSERNLSMQITATLLACDVTYPKL